MSLLSHLILFWAEEWFAGVAMNCERGRNWELVVLQKCEMRNLLPPIFAYAF